MPALSELPWKQSCIYLTLKGDLLAKHDIASSDKKLALSLLELELLVRVHHISLTVKKLVCLIFLYLI